MTWRELAVVWNIDLRAFARRFPYAKPEELEAFQERPKQITRALALRHDLTMGEVREDLEDLLFIASLARGAAEFHATDSAPLTQKRRA